MSEKDQHTPMYSSSDIEKYLNGELSAPEMHALERAALDDPFLADALDGIMIHRRLPEQPPFQEDVAGLRQTLQDRVAKDKNRVRPLFMRYAAAVILLAGLGLTAYYTFLDRGRSKISVLQKVQQEPAPSATIPPPAAENQTNNTLKDTTPPPATSARKQVTSPSLKKEKEEESNTADDVASGQTRQAELVRQAEQFKQTEHARQADQTSRAEKQVLDKAPAPANGQSFALTPSRKASLDTLQLHFDTLSAARGYFAPASPGGKLVFSGKVTDPHNNPLPGAYLALKNNQNINAVTDKNGFFNLRLNNKIDTGSAVLVSHVGYEQASMFLNTENKKGNFIQLQPQAASLNEVEIVGYGSKRKEIMRQNIDAEHKALSLVAVPAVGWPAYKEYLESGKQSANLDSTLRGDETISFIVNKKGELSSFKVEQSISPAHDSATIRMIKQGPAWQLLSGKKARARVILTY